MTAKQEAPRDLWAFMVHVYRQPGVATACLNLQETHGLDIPLLLAVLHGGVRGLALDSGAICMLEDSCASWREQVIYPLRQTRTAMKSHPWMVSAPEATDLRESIKAAELAAEKLEAEMLGRLLSAFPCTSSHCSLKALTGLAAMVLDLYDPARPNRTPEGALLIATACMPSSAAH